ncbi:hypothetical protein [Pseudoalteromonas maricaloris]|uniref:Uncharacterized protein n=1 Tax=Pseudoalteromonas maricaloris TaxID=184924 RepID=A0A8I2H645_9GAMM|nr:hypothetical protein [Pseudoalteromonas maricaloris]NLR21759.1 hypothetical protein [Pseudoalteromonas maricaloris]WOX28297.1 hypothetical protein R5H13_16965 [Pseudoalteromonas maricaloris]
MKYLLFLLLLPIKSFAVNTWDLTDPSNLDIANTYPNYQLLQILSFEDTGNGQSIIGFKTEKSNENWGPVFAASIALSKNGNQRIYIYTARTCNNTQKRYEDIILKTNEKNVRYSKYCDGSIEYLTPRTTAGDNFLESEFKKKNVVVIEFSDIKLVFDARGFTKAWNSKGGDAL